MSELKFLCTCLEKKPCRHERMIEKDSETFKYIIDRFKKKFAQEIFNQLDYDTRTWQIGEKPKSKNDIVFWMKFHNSELYEKVIMKIKRKWGIR